MTILMEGITFGESPRWHDGLVWFSDWGAHQVIALDPRDGHEVVVSVESFPMCIDFLPDGRLLVVDSAQRRLLRRELDGSMVAHADLSSISEKPWNDIVVDARGNAYVNTIGFDFPGGEPAPGSVVLVTPAGAVRTVADDLAFPNGMAITADGKTLIVAESYGNRLTAYDIGQNGDLTRRRTWAEVGDDHPDGSVSTPTGPSGTPTWETDTACGCATAARFLARSNSIEARSPAHSAAAISRHSSTSCARSGATHSHHQSRPGRSSGSRPRRLALGSLRARCQAGKQPGRDAGRSRR
ncbi:MAG: SMP-30/gluconolactonase/LRE family protein [Mycobacterium sp.]|uniref:SMP-30/gluconolactonase/LRE family protein n=1 Tax=Mycobacterium sp. TaxID=1785 RepID=UPI003F9A941D